MNNPEFNGLPSEDEMSFSEKQEKPQKKTPERIQAQIESFADKGLKDFSSDQRLFLEYSAELANVTDLNNLPDTLPPEVLDAIERNKLDYIRFLIKERNTERQFIEENIVKYKEKFQPTIEELKTKLKETDSLKSLPEYLGAGSNGVAFKIEVEGVPYAAKFSKSLTQANFEIKPLLRAKGVKNVAQLEAYSSPDGLVVMDLLPGREVTQVKPEENPEYTDQQIADVIAKVVELDQRGLAVDPKASNFLYDKDKGFSLLDFHLKNQYANIPDSVVNLKVMLSARDWPQVAYDTPEGEDQYVERQKVELAALVKLLTIVRDQFPDIYDDIRNKHAERKSIDGNSWYLREENYNVDNSDIATNLKECLSLLEK